MIPNILALSENEGWLVAEASSGKYDYTLIVIFDQNDQRLGYCILKNII